MLIAGWMTSMMLVYIHDLHCFLSSSWKKIWPQLSHGCSEIGSVLLVCCSELAIQAWALRKSSYWCWSAFWLVAVVGVSSLCSWYPQDWDLFWPGCAYFFWKESRLDSLPKERADWGGCSAIVHEQQLSWHPRQGGVTAVEDSSDRGGWATRRRYCFVPKVRVGPGISPWGERTWAWGGNWSSSPSFG